MNDARTDDLDTHLERIEAKLDRLLAGHEQVESLMDDGLHIAREMVGGVTPTLQNLEERGWFANGREAIKIVEHVMDGYSPEDVRLLAGSIVGILDTVRNLTQHDVLAVANEAGDALHHAEDLSPIGPFGVLKASRDDDVQRGFAVMLEMVRRVGKAVEHMEDAPTRPPRIREPDASATTPSRPRTARPAPVPPPAERPLAHRAAAAKPAAGALARDAHGFLVDPMAWTPELAQSLAAEVGITLTDNHWTVIRWIRGEVEAGRKSPNVRAISKGAGVPIRDLYELFPGGPGKRAAFISGVHKPAGCL